MKPGEFNSDGVELASQSRITAQFDSNSWFH